jgi:hypothetical protein
MRRRRRSDPSQRVSPRQDRPAHTATRNRSPMAEQYRCNVETFTSPPASSLACSRPTRTCPSEPRRRSATSRPRSFDPHGRVLGHPRISRCPTLKAGGAAPRRTLAHHLPRAAALRARRCRRGRNCDAPVSQGIHVADELRARQCPACRNHLDAGLGVETPPRGADGRGVRRRRTPDTRFEMGVSAMVTSGAV